ncbi:MAG TPA: NAD(P)-dependent oxidoreductase [Verrucomicrobiae bacterium]|nr:NAD(P)-dependent oxidoreductase [Verrucomicrobiae bacterium]
MTKIVVTQPLDLSKEQKTKLNSLGTVTFYDDIAVTPEEWLRRCAGFDVVCSGITGLRESYSGLSDVLVTVPFVGVSSFADSEILASRKITLCNSPGSNRHAVSEWIIFMVLETTRKFMHYINTTEEPTTPTPVRSPGLADKNITILGCGNIGKRVGSVCKALDMDVQYFKRGDTLVEKVKDADIVVDTLSANPTTKGLLDQRFFQSLKTGAAFISVTVDATVDFDAMLDALDSNRLAVVAFDVMNAKPGDITNPLYLKLQTHPKVLATPCIASYSTTTSRIGNDMMIANIEAWLANGPIHVFEG